jgi:hypothetical protein
MQFLKALKSIEVDSTLPDYQTKQQSVQRLKSFEACARAIKDSNEDIIKEAFPSVAIDWSGVTAPDQLEDVVFEQQG